MMIPRFAAGDQAAGDVRESLVNLKARAELQEMIQASDACGLVRQDATCCNSMLDKAMPLVGLETVDATSDSNGESGQQRIPGAAESGALDADLQVLIEAWPRLPNTVRANIVAAVKAAR